MKKEILIVLFLLLSCILPACKETEVLQAAETTALPQAQSPYTKEMILDIFNGYAYADPANRTVIDCVVMEESQYGILGVVQYTTEDYEGCWFDFLTTGVPLTAGIEALPTGEKNLAFRESDTVTCRLTTNGEVHTYTLSFYRNDLETGFRLSSDS